MKNNEEEKMIWTIRDMTKVIKGYAGEVRNLRQWYFSMWKDNQKDREKIEKLSSNLRNVLKLLEKEKEKNEKYEKALDIASNYIQSQDICPCEDCLILSGLEDDAEPQCYEEGCGMRLSKYFKHKAGIEE